ncbi:branched-chain amino acid ABC transporter substrate-binding protein [Haladaptatus sp. R4]|uniref:ABC transporter substrate-binding protein n=1 Tax=Haladaptatus sp. R4 TaxID=1679489 RepID=UPI0007B49E1D|nr:ABC transporter substrate-binding protein [Haladaptatus sp. R4]KZN23625.1 branched-chain amino acid ABC transporter substrate-binding protein [Haladaptatus sp. R4]
MRYDIDRRDVLKGLGATGIAGLAGCIGGGGAGDDSSTSKSSSDGNGGGGGDNSGGPDVLNVIGYPESGIQLFRDYYQSTDGNQKIIVPDGLRDSTLPKNVGNDMANLTGTAPAASGPNQKAFNQMYKDEYNREPGVFNSHSYDAVAVLILANVAAGANDGGKIRDQMRRVANPGGQKYGPENFVDAVKAAARGEDINYQGASSVVDFDKKGDPASAAYDVWKFDSSADGGIKTEDTITFEGEPSGKMADSSPGGKNRTAKVGILLPQTGDLGSTGSLMIKAAKMPVKQVNDAGISIKVKSQVEDSQTKKQASLSGANALVSAGFPAICGPASSGNNIPVSQQVYIKQGVVGCSPSSTALTVTNLDDNDFVFRTAPSDLLQGKVMAQVASKKLSGKTASTLFVNNSYGQQLSDKFSKTFTDKYDGEVLQKVSFNKGESSYTSVIKKATGSS